MSKITIINKLLNFLVPPATIAKPETKTLYAVVTGQYCGELLLFAEEIADDFCFISIPKLINRSIPKDKFQLGLTEKIVEPAKTIPKKLAHFLVAQYKYNKNNK